VGLSNSEDFKGKLTYAAPEQVELRPLTYAADLYAVGVVLWELLTGERMYRNRTAAELIAQLLRGEVVAPSSLVQALPAGVDAVVMRALSRDPTGRHESALAMAAALEEAVGPARMEATADWICALAADALRARARLVTEAESETAPSQRHPDLVARALEPTLLAATTVNSPERDPERLASSRQAELRHGFTRVFALAAGVALVWLIGERLWPRRQPERNETQPEQSMRALSFTAGNRGTPGVQPAGVVSSPAYTAPDAAAGSAGGAGGGTGTQREIAVRRETARQRETLSVAAERTRDAIRGAAAKGAPRAAAGRNPGTPVLDCSPPYSLDAEGIRHMKPGCK
jgi:serine/threonine-protein kinase